MEKDLFSSYDIPRKYFDKYFVILSSSPKSGEWLPVTQQCPKMRKHLLLSVLGTLSSLTRPQIITLVIFYYLQKKVKNQHLWGRRDPWEEKGIMEHLEPSSIGFWVKSHFSALHSVTCLVTSPTSVPFSVLWCPLQGRLSFSSKEFLASEWWGESLDKSSSTLS